MSHYKVAKVSVIGAFDGDASSSLKRRAQYAGPPSVYQDGVPQRIDIQDALNLVAAAYDVSPNPSDYVFVVARAVSAELPTRPNPNENGDAFPIEELLRFDHRLARRVYKTFDLKPNHLNHRAQNPKTARGFILDSTFNSLTPEDQFVECLIAIDTTKDPAYARGIRAGAIDAFSMGCIAEYTVCSIKSCQNRATSPQEFCQHIRTGKMRQYGDELAYEKCGGVCFEELSAVDQPADPKALTQEILQVRAQIEDVQQRRDMNHESEMLILSTRLSRLERELQELRGVREMAEETKKVAQSIPAPTPQATPPVPVAAAAPPAADAPMPFAGDQDMPMAFDEQTAAPPDPSAIGTPGDQDLQQYKDKKDLQQGEQMSDDEMGIMSASAQKLSLRFARKFQNVHAEITKVGNARIFDGRTGRGLFVVRPAKKLANARQARQFCEVIVRHVAHFGLADTMKMMRGIPYPRSAQVLDQHDDNLKGPSAPQEPSLSKADDNLQDPRGDATSDSTSEEQSDKQTEPGAGPSTSIESRETNMEDAQQVGDLDSVRNPDSDKRDEPSVPSIGGAGALGDEQHDHEERVGKVSDFYQQKIAAQKSEYEQKIASLEGRVEKLAEQKARSMMQRLERCLYLVADRQRLNHEISPLKIAMADALLIPFDIDGQHRYAGLDTGLVALLVERGMEKGMRDFVASIVARAKEVYGFDDRVISDSERDLRSALVRPVAAAQDGPGESGGRADLEERMLAGNPLLKTSSQSELPEEQQVPNSKQAAVRQAMGKPGFYRAYEEAAQQGPLRRSGG